MSPSFRILRTHRKHQANIAKDEPKRRRPPLNNRDYPGVNTGRIRYKTSTCSGFDTSKLLRETSEILAREITAEENKSIYLARPFDHNNYGD